MRQRLYRLLGIVGLFALLALPARALTLSELRSKARVLALDTGTTRQRFSDSQVTAFLNEGQRQAVLEARPILRSARFELAAGTTYYDLPTDFLQMHRVSNDWQILSEATPESLDRSTEWQLVGAEPNQYYISFASRTRVGFYPFPESTSSTGTIRYEYWAQSTDMSATTDQPYNSLTELKSYHDGLAYYAAGRMSMIEGRQAWALIYLGEFRAMLERMKSEAKSRPSYRPSAAPSMTGGSRGPG